MPDFRVVRWDIHLQDVLVESATNKHDAIQKAARQEGMLSRPSRFHGVILGNMSDRYAEELLDEDPNGEVL